MKTISVRSCVASIVTAVVLLPQISPVLAGAPKGELAKTQGSRFPGMPEPRKETARNKRHGPVEVTFTKWVTTFPLMEGFTGGDVAGDFVGEVLQRQVSLNGRIIRLEAMYEVQDGDHSFTALIRGGTNAVTGAALLDGVILAGWRTGARVHVEFETYAPPPTGPGCPDNRAPDDRNCFQGTIHIERDSED